VLCSVCARVFVVCVCVCCCCGEQLIHHAHTHTRTHTHATQVTMAEMLMHGLGVDAEDSEGRTHLYRAMQSRERGMDTRTVKMLLEHKVCVCVCVCVCTDVGLLKQQLSKS
jgi:hypothetical protein